MRMRAPNVHVDFDKGREPLKRAIDKSFTLITFVMAFSMIIYCIAGIQHYIDDRGPFYAFGIYSVPMVCSALILADRHRSIFFAVGLFAISLAFSRFVTYVQWIHAGNSYYYWAGVVLCILALNMMYSGFRYVSGNSRSITTILMSAFFFTVVMTIELYVTYRYMGGSYDRVEYLRSYGNTIAAVVMYIIYIGLVWSEPIRKSTEVEKMSRTMGAYRASEGAGPNAYIHRDIAECIVDFIRKGNPVESRAAEDVEISEAQETEEFSGEEVETEQGVVASLLMSDEDKDMRSLPSVYSEYKSVYSVDILEDGPVYAQMEFEFNDGIMKVYGILQKWENAEGPVYLCIFDHAAGSLIDVRPNRVSRASIEGAELQIEYSGGRVGRFTIRHVEDGPVRRVHQAKGAA